MNCREFRAQHCAFVDDTLCVAEMAAMRGHLEQCPSCARHDTRIRRSLLLVRNAACVECSPDFNDRLQARLREIGPIDRHGRPATVGYSLVARFTALAAGLVAVTGIAAYATGSIERAVPEVRMAPVVAAAPAPVIDPIPLTVTSPEYVASVMSGMPVWPAVLVAGQSSMHSANHDFQLTGYAP